MLIKHAYTAISYIYMGINKCPH